MSVQMKNCLNNSEIFFFGHLSSMSCFSTAVFSGSKRNVENVLHTLAYIFVNKDSARSNFPPLSVLRYTSIGTEFT